MILVCWREKLIMKIYFALMLTYLTISAANSQTQYLGQPVPGTKPVVLARGTISLPNQTEFGSVFSSDGAVFYYAVEPGGKAEIRAMKLVSNKWIGPEVVISHEKYSYNDPYLSPDERRLYFISNMPLNGTGATKDYDIWFIERKGNGWSEPINAGPMINSHRNEYYMSFTKSGTMYFSSNVNATDEKGENFDIYAAKHIKGEFQKPVKLGNTVNTPYYEADVFVDRDEAYLIFTSSRPGGNGRGDLYIAYKLNDGSWGEARNLGQEINGVLSEYCPFVTADGKYFFYTKENDIYWVDATILKSFR
jgi:hypothetical protein